MSKAQLVITAVVLGGRSKTAVGLDYEVSRQWVHQLVSRYQAEGAAAFAPRSRRPHTNAHAISPELEERIVRLRKRCPNRATTPARPPSPNTSPATPTSPKFHRVVPNWSPKQ
jgi:transposase